MHCLTQGFLHSDFLSEICSSQYLLESGKGTVRPMQANSHMKGDMKGTKKKIHTAEQTRVPEPDYRGLKKDLFFSEKPST